MLKPIKTQISKCNILLNFYYVYFRAMKSDEKRLVRSESRESAMSNRNNAERNKATPDSIHCTVSVKRMDYLGREYTDDSHKEAMAVHISYLKLINVPSMFDIGCTQADPRTDFLTLSMMDSITHKVLKKEFLGKKPTPGLRQVADIEMHRQQLQAIHTNMQVSSTDIKFEDEPLILGGPSPDYHLTIDGKKVFAEGKKEKEVEVVHISVSRLLLNDRTQASIPIMTFLPLKEGELQNQHINPATQQK